MLLCLGKPNLVPDICVATQGFPLPAALGRTGVHWEEGARRGQCLEEFAAADHQLCLTSVYCLENSQILQAAPALHGAGDGSFSVLGCWTPVERQAWERELFTIGWKVEGKSRVAY